jgi:hypothetical protein
MAVWVFEARYPSERPGPSDPVPNRAILSNSTERVVEHEEEEFRFRFSRVARQNNLKALGWHRDS